MFARLGSFEAMLYKNFEDEHRKNLATLLRLWVNTLRAGKLITVDIVGSPFRKSHIAQLIVIDQANTNTACQLRLERGG